MTAVLRVFSREVYRASCRRDGQLPFACVVGNVLAPRGFATDAKVGSMKFNASKKVKNKTKLEQRISRLVTYILNLNGIV